MEIMKSSAAAVCAVSAGICIIESLISGTRLRKQMKMLFDIILAFVVIAPFVKGGLEFELPDIYSGTYSYEDAAEMYNESLRRQASYNISEVLLGQIRAAGIICYKIETEVNISDDGSISINKVTLRADDFERAAGIVQSSLGADTEVINEAG